MGSPPRPPPVAKRRPPPPPGSDRRGAERVKWFAHVELRTVDGDVALVPIINIAIGGALLGVNHGTQFQSLNVGDRVRVSVSLEDHDALDLNAGVVRVVTDDLGRPLGLAVMWTFNDVTVMQRLAAVLQQQSVAGGDVIRL
jgi:hypothetical protein